jgi:hypothetical protein
VVGVEVGVIVVVGDGVVAVGEGVVGDGVGEIVGVAVGSKTINGGKKTLSPLGVR